jgi:hypothetical protein
MKSAALLAAGLFVATPAFATVTGQNPSARPAASFPQQDLMRLAQPRDCYPYGRANKCKVRYDRRTNQCVCVGR